MDKREFAILAELEGELEQRSPIKAPSRAETIRHAIEFTRDNINLLELVDNLKNDLDMEKRKNEFLLQTFNEYQEKINCYDMYSEED